MRNASASHRRSRGLATLLAAALLSGLAGCGNGRASPAPVASPAGPTPGLGPASQWYPTGRRQAPEPVSGTLLDGASLDLTSLVGTVVVVNFWASWCAPCRVETADLVAVYQATHTLGVSFLGVDVRDGHDAATSFVEAFHVPYPSLYDPAGRTALAFRDVLPSAIPTTVVLDRSGRVAAVYRKRISQQELDQAVRTITAEQ